MPAFLLLALLRSSSIQSAETREARPTPVAVRTREPEFNALMLKYGAATRDYDDRRVRLDRERSTAPAPPHPARRFLPEFLALAEKDSGGAQGWVLENLRVAIDDPKERVRIANEIFPKLAAKHADEDSALHAISGIRELSGDLGEAASMEMARTLEAKGGTDEIKAEAMLLQAWIHSQGGTTTDPERLKDTHEIHLSILYTLPKTRAGMEVAGILLGPVGKKFFDMERNWVDRLRDLQAAGKPPAEWPPQPIRDLLADYVPIANANHHTAQLWVNKLLPSYEQVEGQGRPFAYQWLAVELGSYYYDGVDGPWSALRADLLTILYKQFPTEKWVYASLRRLLPAVEGLPGDRLEPGFQALLEKNQEPRVRALANFAMGQCAKVGGDQRSYERAIEYYTKARDELPEGEVRISAESARAGLASCMPGRPAPSSPAPDADGQSFSVADYKGRVVMLEFWSFEQPACMAAIPSRAALVRELKDKPFSMVGVNFDNLKPEEYRRRASEAGVTWRSAVVYFNHAVMDGWEVRRFPTTILIDKKGIIRGRDLPWSEMVALAKSLVDEPN